MDGENSNTPPISAPNAQRIGGSGHIGVIRQRQAESAKPATRAHPRPASAFVTRTDTHISARLYASGAHPASGHTGYSLAPSAAPPAAPPTSGCRPRPSSATLARHRERQNGILDPTMARQAPAAYSLAVAPGIMSRASSRPGSAASTAAAAREARLKQRVNAAPVMPAMHPLHVSRALRSEAARGDVRAAWGAPSTASTRNGDYMGGGTFGDHMSQVGSAGPGSVHEAAYSEMQSRPSTMQSLPGTAMQSRPSTGMHSAMQSRPSTGMTAMTGIASTPRVGLSETVEEEEEAEEGAAPAVRNVDRMLAEVAELLKGQAFAYLARRGAGYDPYDLRIVSAHAVRKGGPLHDHHYTISEAGITQVRALSD